VTRPMFGLYGNTKGPAPGGNDGVNVVRAEAVGPRDMMDLMNEMYRSGLPILDGSDERPRAWPSGELRLQRRIGGDPLRRLAGRIGAKCPHIGSRIGIEDFPALRTLSAESGRDSMGLSMNW